MRYTLSVYGYITNLTHSRKRYVFAMSNLKNYLSKTTQKLHAHS